jgi:hypothetical protein
MAKTSSLRGFHTLSKTLGLACAIHCISLPFLLAFLPGTLGHLLAHPLAEAGFALFSLFFLTITLYRDFKRHKNPFAAMVVLFGFFLLIGEHLWSHDHHGLLIPLLSAFIMLIGFWLNWKAGRSTHVCQTSA